MQTAGITVAAVDEAGEVSAGVEPDAAIAAAGAGIHPSAVVTVDDSLAIGAMQAVQQAGCWWAATLASPVLTIRRASSICRRRSLPCGSHCGQVGTASLWSC
ncbi:MAG: hypothetical protein R2911_39940 [Caldilineaceae bacterium]